MALHPSQNNIVALKLYAGEQEFDCIIKMIRNPDSCSLSLSAMGPQEELLFSSTNADYFSALSDIRLLIEKQGLLLGCNGSRHDFYPSRMSLEMSDGKVGYLLTINKPSSQKARTFSPCYVIDKLCTVSEQEKSFQEWRDSIRNPNGD